MAKASDDVPAWLRPAASSRSVKAPIANATVYMGSDLMRQVTQLREQGIDINVSMVCREALKSAVKQAYKRL